jgi:hypothetical protein
MPHRLDVHDVLVDLEGNLVIFDTEGRCHVVESLMRVRRVSQLKSCGGDDFAPRLHG